eukprot:32582-Prymnesium_polylepis.1
MLRSSLSVKLNYKVPVTALPAPVSRTTGNNGASVEYGSIDRRPVSAHAAPSNPNAAKRVATQSRLSFLAARDRDNVSKRVTTTRY